MPRIYTRTGDTGQTGLFGGGRVPKAHARVEAYGDVDELNAVLGWVATDVDDEPIRGRLESIQADLFTVGAQLATPPAKPGRRRPNVPSLRQGRVQEIEAWIDEAEEQLPELRAFILPGGSPTGAALHLVRTVCRRVERRVVALAAEEDVEPELIVYLNRLSDLFFVFARQVNLQAGEEEIRWEPRASDEDDS